jgi:S23 ribosomal protein.
MGTIARFEELQIWQTARQLASKVFEITNTKDFRIDFRFKSQCRASSGSVMDNIAEGFERSSRLEFIIFLGYAKGSCGEIRSQLYRAIDQNFLKKEEGDILINEYEILSKRITKFITYLNSSKIKGQKFKDRIADKP